MQKQAAIHITESMELFHALKGAWDLVRTIDGRIAQGRFLGRCSFTPIDNRHLHYSECGVLDVAGHLVDGSTRQFIYAFEAGRILILYDDPFRKGEIMHELQFKDGYAAHSHVCVADRYDLSFHVVNSGQIRINYTVKGPEKDYHMESVLSRRAEVS